MFSYSHEREREEEKNPLPDSVLLFKLFFPYILVFWFIQDAIFRVVAAILHLGNIEFTDGQETDSSQPKDAKSWFHLKTAAELFM